MEAFVLILCLYFSTSFILSFSQEKTVGKHHEILNNPYLDLSPRSSQRMIDDMWNAFDAFDEHSGTVKKQTHSLDTHSIRQANNQHNTQSGTKQHKLSIHEEYQRYLEKNRNRINGKRRQLKQNNGEEYQELLEKERIRKQKRKDFLALHDPAHFKRLQENSRKSKMNYEMKKKIKIREYMQNEGKKYLKSA